MAYQVHLPLFLAKLLGNRRILTETLAAIVSLPNGPYLESGGQVVMEAEGYSGIEPGATHDWLLKNSQSGYTDTGYVQTFPDIDALYQSTALTGSPRIDYPINFTATGVYTLWLRGYQTNPGSDSVYVDFNGAITEVTGFAPDQWSWSSEQSPGGAATTLSVGSSGVYTLSLWMREDGLQIDRLLLTTDTTYLPTGYGPAESARQPGTVTTTLSVDRVIDYDYDDLYRLTEASYSTGELYEYDYDPVGNRLEQIIDGDTTEYLYDAANRLEQLNGQAVYSFDANGNLLVSDVLTNTFDTANRLIKTKRAGSILEPVYNGVNDRVAQVSAGVTTTFALDVQGLPEVIYTSEGNAYLHLPGLIMTENISGEVRYLLADGLGSVRQALDDTAAVVAYHEFDPYGNPTDNRSLVTDYGFTGEWWQAEVGLLHLRARWYLPGDGVFLSVDPVEGEPPYQYVRGNVVNLVDPSGSTPWPRTAIGTDYMYSCRCGWIDWKHAKSRPKVNLIQRIDKARTDSKTDFAIFDIVELSATRRGKERV